MISFRSAGVSYGDTVVLQPTTLDLTEQRVGIIGANGGGKSTLARLINGLTEPSTGRVDVNGLDVASDGAAVRRQVGYLFTDPDAQIVMPTVAEDVAFSLRRLKLDRATSRERVAAALARFGLSAFADSPAHSLSGGQKQLLALASILVLEPRIVVADEPTTLLDLRNTDLISRVFADLPQQLVLVTHNLGLLTGWERVICLDEGAVVADGSAAEVVDFYRRRMQG